MKAIVILAVMFLNMQPVENKINSVFLDENILIVKNQAYNGRSLDALFKITYSNPASKEKRFFEVIKTDNNLKNFFLADYLLVEKINAKTEYYPLGWMSDKITETDIKLNCRSIIKGEISPIVPD